MQSQARYIEPFIASDLKRKMVLVAGPRQVGKTTLALQLIDDGRYYNWDHRADRKAIPAAEWPVSPSVIVLDELHKYRFWKRWIFRLSLSDDAARRGCDARNVHPRQRLLPYAALAAAYGQLDEPDSAQNALRELLAQKPDFALEVRAGMGKWFTSEDALEHYLDGLRKAGLPIPEADEGS